MRITSQIDSYCHEVQVRESQATLQPSKRRARATRSDSPDRFLNALRMALLLPMASRNLCRRDSGLVHTLPGSKTVGAHEAKTHLSELLEKVAAGEEITISKHGAAIAKLVPVREGASPGERLAAIARLQSRALGLSLGGLKVKDLIREGRDERCVRR